MPRYFNKANMPTMRPRWWAVSVVVVAAAVMVAVAPSVVGVSPFMILCFQKDRFSRFLKRRNGPSYGSMDAQTVL